MTRQRPTTTPRLRRGTSKPRPRVLVVDDEAIIVATVARMLRREFEVTTAGSGAEALAVLLGDGPAFDAVLCDISMAATTGKDVYDALVAAGHPSADRMIFMTGGATTAEVEAFLAGLADRVVFKPFHQRELLARLDALRPGRGRDR